MYSKAVGLHVTLSSEVQGLVYKWCTQPVVVGWTVNTSAGCEVSPIPLCAQSTKMDYEVEARLRYWARMPKIERELVLRVSFQATFLSAPVILSASFFRTAILQNGEGDQVRPVSILGATVASPTRLAA